MIDGFNSVGAWLFRPRKHVRRKGASGSPVEWLARAGYGARGLVYVALGALAVLAAGEFRRSATGLEGAIRAFAQWPLGPVWLVFLAAGLGGFVLWRVAQSVLDADRQGTSKKALANRAGQAISAVIYSGLALSCLEALDGLEEGLDGGDAQEMRELLALPWGEWLLLAMGASVAVAGVLNALHGMFGGFRRHLVCDDGVQRWAVPLARTGYFVRGAVFLGLAFFLVEAGLDLAPAHSATVGGALQALEGQPFGSWLLAAAGAGLIAFGLFGLVEAFYRRIEPPALLTP